MLKIAAAENEKQDGCTYKKNEEGQRKSIFSHGAIQAIYYCSWSSGYWL